MVTIRRSSTCRLGGVEGLAPDELARDSVLGEFGRGLQKVALRLAHAHASALRVMFFRGPHAV